jgi:hypothetical protein
MKTLLILLTFALPLAIPVLGNPTSYVDELVMFDEYLFQDRLKTKRQRLENLSAALRERPSETVYIVAFGAPKGSNCESVPELRFARNYLVDVLRVNPRRFVLIDGGIGHVARTEFYLLPSDAIFPEDSIRYRINDVLNPNVRYAGEELNETK